MITTHDLTWRKSSFSGSGSTGGGNCVEAALLDDDRCALRDSKNPDAGWLLLPTAGLTALLTAQKTTR